MGNVKSMPTRINDEQPWRCQVCGGVLAYSQPINFRLAMELGKLFCDWHDKHCKPAETAEKGGKQDV